MVQSPSWEAKWFAASQEIPRISRNPKVHYRTHKLPPPVSILGQPNPVHTPTSHLLEIHPNIIHPSTPRSPHWSPSLRFPQQDPIHPLLLTHTCPAYFILLDFITKSKLKCKLKIAFIIQTNKFTIYKYIYNNSYIVSTLTCINASASQPTCIQETPTWDFPDCICSHQTTTSKFY